MPSLIDLVAQSCGMSTEQFLAGATPEAAAADPAAPIERVRRVVPAYLAGRCANGNGRDRGPLIHAVDAIVRPDAGVTYLDSARALCGATYGRRSAGFFMAEPGTPYTCPRCAKRAAAAT